MTETHAPSHAEAHTGASDEIHAQHAKVVKQFDEMVALGKSPDKELEQKALGVSEWSVGQHLDHMATSAKMMLTAIFMLIGSKSPGTEGEPSFMGRLVLYTGYIPRGKGKAPDATMPRSKNLAEVRNNVKMVQGVVAGLETKLGQIETCAGRTPHPALGAFNAANWLRFIEIHTNHHFKIIRDIQKKRK